MKIGYFRVDIGGNYYIIPEECIEEHDELSEDINEVGEETFAVDALINKYEQTFGCYKIHSLADYKIIMED